MYDCFIIGAGPAGISAALYVANAGFKTAVVTSGKSALCGASFIGNYYGFKEGIKGKELYEAGIMQARNIGVEVFYDEIVGAEYDGNFTLVGKSESYISKTLVLATGKKRNKPNILNLDKFEGIGVSYCAVCDGFFMRGKKVFVLGDGDYAYSEAKYLKNLAGEITILTNGTDKKFEDINTLTDKVTALSGNERLSEIVFENGQKVSADGLFIALGTATGDDMAKKLGAVCKDGSVSVDENMKTSIKGLYAIGDLRGGVLQVSKAVNDGTVCGLDIIKLLKSIKEEK